MRKEDNNYGNSNNLELDLPPYTFIENVREKKFLFDVQRDMVIIGDISVIYSGKEYHLVDDILFGLAGDIISLSNEIYSIRPATENDYADAVSFQTLLQRRIPQVSLMDLYKIRRFEDYYLTDFHDCMLYRKDIADEEIMVGEIFAMMGYPSWFHLFDSDEGVVETVTMFVRKFIGTKFWM